MQGAVRGLSLHLGSVRLLIELVRGDVDVREAASGLSGSTWLLVGLFAIGTVLTWAFVRASDDAAIAPEHQAHRHFHLPWVGRLSAPSRTPATD